MPIYIRQYHCNSFVPVIQKVQSHMILLINQHSHNQINKVM